VERDISREAPAAIEQQRKMPGGIAGSREGVNARNEFRLILNQLDAVT
jgi:hypothetical protein